MRDRNHARAIRDSDQTSARIAAREYGSLALDVVTKIMVWLGDAAFAVLSFCSPAVALWIISALTGVLMLLIWRYTSNQKAIAGVRATITANLLATRLFKDNLSVTFAAQRRIIWQAIRLLGLSFQPMIIMLAPFVLVMVQIGLRYEYRPCEPGRPVRVMATVKESAVGSDARWNYIAQHLELPPGVTMDRNDPCRAKPLRTIDWRLTPAEAGDFTLTFGRDADVVEMPLRVGDGFKRISKLRGGAFFDRLLYSAEASIPESSVFEEIHIFYETRSTPICGIDVHWLITLLVLSIVFALLFKPFMKVHI